ncbi:hypothetical protein ACFE04_005212 [Oxalis oulophora]
MVETGEGDSSAPTEENNGVREICANGARVLTSDLEAKLDQGNLEDAESSLREGLSLTSEDARSLLGRLEYQRGNIEAALRVFDSIDLHAAIDRFQPSLQAPPKKARSRSEAPNAVSQHAASLVLEAVFLKAKSLQKLGKLNDAAQECKSVLDAVEKIFNQGIADPQVDTKLQETVSLAVELLPELWRQAGNYNEAISSYRRALLSQWSLNDECCGRIQKGFAVFLLHSGVEASPPSLASQVEGSYVPKNNLEEAILLLMIVMKKFFLGKIKWDMSVIEHLTYALSLCSQTSVLAKQFEEILPGVYNRVDRWNILALCYSGAGENIVALNSLRKSLHKIEKPDDLIALLLAAKICSEDSDLAAEGVGYAQRAIEKSQGTSEHFKSVGHRVLGSCLGQQAKVSTSDFERSRLQSDALKSLNEAITLERDNPDLIFELGVQYAEQRNLPAALRCAKRFIDATGGSLLKGWRLLALVLSAQQRFSEAEVVIDAALDETAKWEQGPLLRLKAKLKICRSQPMDAIETYRYLLALVQAQRKSIGSLRSLSQIEDDKINEFQVWHGLANLYSSLSYWKDVEICLGKARELKPYSAEALHTEGVMCQRRDKILEALSSYINGVLLEPSYVPCKVLICSVLSKMGRSALPVARAILSDALRLEPTNRLAWCYLGMIHKDDGRLADAADCFQAASMLEESDPIESFNSIL